ncbi:MAG: ATP-dependent DNA helicase DinG [Gammaproteobacteria bacterium]|nr:ATP-dependent DNA helicase DinG [Gammaproteobacteria bacterium]
MLSDQVKQDIQSYYSQYLQNRNLQARFGQKLMIAEIARTLGKLELDDDGKRTNEFAPVCVVEAGTGTGKTIAYLIAALPVARALGKQLVVATATVALQEQLMQKDIPELQANTDLHFTSALAKGRGRYLCLSRLDNVLRENASQTAMQDLYGLELEDSTDLDLKLYQNMQKALEDKDWQGERDDWPQVLEDKQWRAVSVEHGQCSGSRCSNFRSCYFFRSRQRIQESECIIANQDLVLADLSLGGGAILPHPEDSIYIFDEAHHLPIKGVSHFANFLALRFALRWLDQARKLFTRLQAQGSNEFQGLFEKADGAALELREKVQETFLLFEQFASQTESGTAAQKQYTFPRGVLPDALRDSTAVLYLSFSQLSQALDSIMNKVRRSMEDQGGALPAETAEAWYPQLGLLQTRCESALTLCLHFSAEDEPGEVPQARWLAFSDGQDEEDIILSCSPILAAANLTEKLWDECLAAVLTSATLSALGSFDFLSMRAGLHDETHLCRIGSPFDHASAAVLRVPESGFDAGDGAGHTQAIIAYLPVLLEKDKAALVLFSSRRQMQDVLYGLNDEFKSWVLCQDDYSKQLLIKKHKQAVDAGDRSIIFGLASMSEGVDLPGAYCTHVVIAKLPFAVPDNPVDLTLGQWMKAQGLNPFQELSVPEAAMKLVQASGRLLRNEKDQGSITVLDERLLTRQYGKAILDSMPDYRLEKFRPE